MDVLPIKLVKPDKIIEIRTNIQIIDSMPYNEKGLPYC